MSADRNRVEITDDLLDIAANVIFNLFRYQEANPDAVEYMVGGVWILLGAISLHQTKPKVDANELMDAGYDLLAIYTAKDIVIDGGES